MRGGTAPGRHFIQPMNKAVETATDEATPSRADSGKTGAASMVSGAAVSLVHWGVPQSTSYRPPRRYSSI